MTHIQREVGQQLAAALSAHVFTGAISSVQAVYRRYPDYEIADTATLKVSVVPGPFSMKPNTRGNDEFEPMIGIVMAKHITEEDEIDSLEDLAQQIADAVRGYQVVVADVGSAVDWREIAIPVPFDLDMLRDRSVYLSQIEVTYSVFLDKPGR